MPAVIFLLATQMQMLNNGRPSLRVAAALVLAFGPAGALAEPYPVRWFYLETNFLVEENAERAVQLVEQAGKLGFNGVIVGDGKFFTLEKYGLDAPGHRYRRNVSRFVEACRHSGIEIIPQVPGPSRACGILAYDPNLAAGYAVRGAVFEVRDQLARLVPDPVTGLLDGDFEDAEGNVFPGWSRHDRPGRATLPDREVFKFGLQSARLEPAGGGEHGQCRFQQWVTVRPHRYYRVSVWLNTKGLTPARAFNMPVYGKLPNGKRKPLTYNRFDTKSTQDWTRVDTVFNSLNCTEVMVYMGLWGARSGRAWLDGAEITEIGLVNVLRRPGCPLTVTSQDGRVSYAEGRDFEPVFDPKLGQARWAGTYDRYHEPPAIRMRPDFPNGARLAVSFYHPMLINESQVDCCMTEEKVFEVVGRSLVRLDRLLGRPKRYMLGIDELRTGGGCAACKATGKTPGQLLGQYVRRCAAVVRHVKPEAELMVWSDMFDPNHNAREDYYLVDGSLAGSWEGLDRDIIVCPWYFKKREASLKFFAARGHQVVASVCLDGIPDPESAVRSWLKSMDDQAGTLGLGLLYTTWRKQYGSLDLFAKLVGTQQRPKQPRD